jgi:RNA polymerase sigma-70 factor (ECF subfamily)
VSKVPAPTPSSVSVLTEMSPPSKDPGPAVLGADLSPRDREARLAALLRTHFRMVWRALRRLGVPEHAVDDAAQEVFIVAAKKLETIAPTYERRFLYGVALRVAANARRARAARPERAEMAALEETASATPSPEALLDRKRARELLDTTLESMPDDLRTAFVLFELEGCSAPEVAALLGIPLGTATSRLRRSREAFRAAVSRLRRRLENGDER